MSEMLNQLLSGPVKIVLAGMIIFIIALYLLSIIWVIRDAKARNTSSVMWGIIAIIPVAGLVAYCLLRPSLTEADQVQLNIHVRQYCGKSRNKGT